MELDLSDVEKVQAWFKSHWKDPVTCSVCKTTSWTYGAQVVQFFGLPAIH